VAPWRWTRNADEPGYREIRAPERIAFTEIWDEDWTGGETLVTLVLAE
jgi:uncharacterized protein YndB with AHSA1/START domain